MDPLTIALLIALAGTAVGAGTSIVNDITSASKKNKAEVTQDELAKLLPDQALLDQLQADGFTGSEIDALLSNYTEDTIGNFQSDYGALKDSLQARPEAPVYSDLLTAARTEASSDLQNLYASLDSDLRSKENILNEQLGMYNTQLSDISNDYNRMRSDIQANQYRQNAQLMDTLQSGMEKSRRNALESGASAGIRIADNINTLLSVQNKQSNTSMETANQLAQMMVNQRNAEHGVYNSMYSARNAYQDAASQHTYNKHNLKLESDALAESKAKSDYDVAYNDYNRELTDWDNSMYSNPLYDQRQMIKSKFSQGGNK